MLPIRSLCSEGGENYVLSLLVHLLLSVLSREDIASLLTAPKEALPNNIGSRKRQTLQEGASHFIGFRVGSF